MSKDVPLSLAMGGLLVGTSLAYFLKKPRVSLLRIAGNAIFLLIGLAAVFRPFIPEDVDSPAMSLGAGAAIYILAASVVAFLFFAERLMYERQSDLAPKGAATREWMIRRRRMLRTARIIVFVPLAVLVFWSFFPE